jgi:hypothetical protein
MPAMSREGMGMVNFSEDAEGFLDGHKKARKRQS